MPYRARKRRFYQFYYKNNQLSISFFIVHPFYNPVQGDGVAGANPTYFSTKVVLILDSSLGHRRATRTNIGFLSYATQGYQNYLHAGNVLHSQQAFQIIRVISSSRTKKHVFAHEEQINFTQKWTRHDSNKESLNTTDLHTNDPTPKKRKSHLKITHNVL